METDLLAKQVRFSKWIVVAAMFLALGLYCWEFGWFQLTNTRDAWGQFGDFFGGILNPIISAAAFYWLATSILLQKQELTETRGALIESQQAQQDLANTALITARINKLNIRLSVVASQLGNLRTREAYLWEKSFKLPGNSAIRNLKGEFIHFSDAIDEVREEIEHLEKREQELLAEVDSLGAD